MAKNKNLNAAARAKKDEFYTRLEDIERELKYYRPFFKNKTVLCNCDDPYESNFFQYFAMNFEALELKKLIATCYDGSPVAGTQLSLFDTPVENPQERKAFKVEINSVKDLNKDGAIDLVDVELLIKTEKNVLTMLEGNGDFRSAECIELLKQADVVVTNPPFSLFREYVAQLIKYDKKFLIIGNINCITYKEIFPLIKADKIWLGESIHSGDREFRVPDYYPLEAATCGINEDGIRFIRIKGVRWFTNIKIEKFREDIPLFREYYKTPEMFPRYDNYDAIEVSHTADIPEDYFGVMGVPITFLDKYNPAQFEILGHTSSNDLSPEVEALRTDPKNRNRGIIDGQQKYDRILIRRRAQDD